MNKQQAKQEIMDNFDFEKVFKVMVVLSWRWSIKGVLRAPTVEEIKDTASSIIDSLLNSDYREIQSGGFTARYEESEDDKYIKLEFVIEHYEGKL